VTLGVNENEARQLAAAVGAEPDASLEKMGEQIFRTMRIRTLLIHPVDCCIAVTAEGILREQGRLVPHPVLSTGGGDNFNAGFCCGWLQGMSLAESMRLGMRVSGWYVEHGYSPSRADLK
jgi:sugar/nucleoside kinase (ribokinase family)